MLSAEQACRNKRTAALLAEQEEEVHSLYHHYRSHYCILLVSEDVIRLETGEDQSSTRRGKGHD